MKKVLFALFISLSLAASAQEPTIRPYVSGGLGLNSGGYAPTSAVAGAGLIGTVLPRVTLSLDGNYNSARKSFDGTSNPHGYSLGGGASAFYHPEGSIGHWYLGGGASYGTTVTTNYTKSAWHPHFGGGYDYIVPGKQFSLRGQAEYVLPGNDHLNGTQGVDLELWIPSPAQPGHWFYRQGVRMYRFHDTLTDPNNQYLTQLQLANHSFATFVRFTVLYRF